MSLHNKPKYQIPELIESLKAHGLDADEPSQLSDAFRTGWIAARAALAAQPGSLEAPDFAEWLKSRQADSYSCSLLVRDALAQLATPPSAAAPTEAKPVQQDAVDAEALRFAEMSMAAMRDALMPSFEYVGVSLRISQEDHAAIRSALAGMSTSLQMVRAAISAKKGGAA